MCDIKREKMTIVRQTNNNQKKNTFHASTYRRIRHAPSHLVGIAIRGGTVAASEATRRRHLHLVGWIHRHSAHAAARREILLELQRFGGAFEWSWRINFADFLLHLREKEKKRAASTGELDCLIASLGGVRRQRAVFTFPPFLPCHFLLSKFLLVHFHFIIISISFLWVVGKFGIHKMNFILYFSQFYAALEGEKSGDKMKEQCKKPCFPDGRPSNSIINFPGKTLSENSTKSLRMRHKLNLYRFDPNNLCLLNCVLNKIDFT